MSYKRIKYQQEYDNTYRVESTSYAYIFFCFLFPIIAIISVIIIAVISKNFRPQYGIPLIILFGLILFSVPLLLYIRRRRGGREEDVFRKMRKRFISNGTLFYGVITGIKEIKSTETIFIRRRPRDVVMIRYIYTARYTNGNNEEKEVESYNLIRADKDAVGKKCTIYECEGTTLMQAIEQ